MYAPRILKARRLKSRCQQRRAPLVPGKNLAWPLAASGGCQPSLVVFVPDQHPSNVLRLCQHTALSLCVWLCPVPFSYEETSRWIRVCSNPVQTYLNLITSAEVLFPNKATVTGSEWVFEGHYSIQYSHKSIFIVTPRFLLNLSLYTI